MSDVFHRTSSSRSDAKAAEASSNVVRSHETEQPSARIWTALVSFDHDMNSRLDIVSGNLNAACFLSSVQESNPDERAPLGHCQGRNAAGWSLATVAKVALGALAKLFRKHSAFVSSADARGSSHSRSHLDTLHRGLGLAIRSVQPRQLRPWSHHIHGAALQH